MPLELEINIRKRMDFIGEDYAETIRRGFAILGAE